MSRLLDTDRQPDTGFAAAYPNAYRTVRVERSRAVHQRGGGRAALTVAENAGD